MTRTWTAKRAATVAVVIALSAIAVWFAFYRKPAQPRVAATSSHGGMAGMEGMQMSSDGSVTISPEQIRQFGITFGTVELRALQHLDAE